MINVLAYADDIVLCATSWRGLQQLLDILAIEVYKIDVICNVKETVCLVFASKDRSKMVSPVLQSSRTSPWPRGASRTVFQVLGLSLASGVEVLAFLGLGG
jgi:hypothetical protein